MKAKYSLLLTSHQDKNNPETIAIGSATTLQTATSLGAKIIDSINEANGLELFIDDAFYLFNSKGEAEYALAIRDNETDEIEMPEFTN